jgi:hypothetical protein
MIVQVTNFNSSNVERFDYDSATERLTVQYKSGRKRYVYTKVDHMQYEHLFSQAFNNGSVGGAMQFIKQHFDCEIEEDFLP